MLLDYFSDVRWSSECFQIEANPLPVMDPVVQFFQEATKCCTDWLLYFRVKCDFRPDDKP